MSFYPYEPGDSVANPCACPFCIDQGIKSGVISSEVDLVEVPRIGELLVTYGKGRERVPCVPYN